MVQGAFSAAASILPMPSPTEKPSYIVIDVHSVVMKIFFFVILNLLCLFRLSKVVVNYAKSGLEAEKECREVSRLRYSFMQNHGR